MKKQTRVSLDISPTIHGYLPLVVILFVGSGCAALIYEVVWLQLLQLVIGSSGISLGVLLGTFMGFFKAGNIAGAVLGCLLSGFYLLRLYNMPAATYVAVAINVSVAVLIRGTNTFILLK